MTDLLNILVLALIIVPQILAINAINKAMVPYVALYRKKMNLDYPVLPSDTADYLRSPKDIAKIFLSPAVIWQIMLERHKDKELNKAASKVRRKLLVYFMIFFSQAAIFALYIMSFWK